MARVISVYLPLWPFDRLRRQAGEAAPSSEAPLVLAGQVRSQRLIIAADEVALSFGLYVAMPVSKAQALMPGLQVLLADPAADAASFERLALWVLHRISPIVAVNARQAGDRLHRREEEPVSADCSTSPLCSDSASLRERL